MRRASLVSALAIAAIAVTAAASATGAATAAQPGELTGLEYVALGDSYQAGFGLEPYSTTTPFTGNPNGCYQSQDDYPSRVAASLGLDVTDQTCSGAVTANIGYPDGVTFTNPPAAQPLPALATGDELQVTLAGLTVPELQKAGLSDSTAVVTVGIGGNDLGFSHIAEACIRTGVDPSSEPVYLALELGISVPNCADYFGDPTTYPTADLFTRMTDAVAPRIDGVLDAIAELAPNAQVFVVGYPMVTPADATNACFTDPTTPNSVPFSGTDLEFIHSVEIALDGALQTGAEEHGFHFVTSWASSANNTLCSAEPWIWGLTAYENSQPTCDANYLPVLNGEICVELGALHPTADGIANLARLTTAAVDSAFFVEPASASVAVGAGTSIRGGGFQPGETVLLRLTSGSRIVDLGTATADASGSFTKSVTLPAGSPTGAVTVSGTGATSGRSFSSPLQVSPALAATGTDAAAPAALAAALLVLGAAALTLTRRRRAA
ncbi:GDSL-type esterase/lipase family protein [Salinibacterium soli]|uniref:GDSL-type esterase/lipase family protein n=1 Tax=Antiquaquibacter soli TaxID=3064523 RepID=A0ABT9BQ26_9MICO|nr:GDSL-type esterase/lipase family protein [Protaetiibacter sp. WY-16]MDO7883123.1 GDSL-type esterase/lipase family protein [Protaetiibacter sp. WY-16]